MMLIEDLGYQEYGSKGCKQKYGIYECPTCKVHFRCRTSHVKDRSTSRCLKCGRSVGGKANMIRAAGNFIKRAIEVHGSTYDYSLVEYAGSHKGVSITCLEHGVFTQEPQHHTNGHGCPECAMYGFDKSKSAVLYYLRVTSNGTTMYKIGITNRTVQDRFSNDDLSKIVVVKIWEFASGVDSYDKEQEILKAHKEFKYSGERVLSSGNTEMFTRDILELDK